MVVRGILGHQHIQTPEPHPSGAVAPKLPGELIPNHVAIVMDGNGRWAKERGLPRTEGHKVGAERVLDVLQGAIEMGVGAISLYAFSTENWKRSPDEVRFLMNFNRDFIRKTRDQLDELGIRVRWVGRMPKLWKSVAKELQISQEQTKDNNRLTLYFCMNYGGRAEITDLAQAFAEDIKAGRLDPSKVTEKTFAESSTPGHARRGPVPAAERRAAHLQLPALAERVRRDGLPERAVAGLRPARPVAGVRRVRPARPPLRRGCPERATARDGAGHAGPRGIGPDA